MKTLQSLEKILHSGFRGKKFFNITDKKYFAISTLIYTANSRENGYDSVKYF